MKYLKTFNENIQPKVEDYLTKCEFDDLPLNFKKGLLTWMYEGDPVEWSIDNPINDWNNDENVNTLIDDYSREKGDQIFEYGFIPKELIIDKLQSWLDEEYNGNFNEWYEPYQSTNDIDHGDSLFPIIVNDNNDEYIDDGWHRFSYYISKGYDKIPLIRF